MKKLIIAIAIITMGSSMALANETRCDIANLKICVLDLDSESVMIAVHNSGVGYKGLEIYSNQNHGLSMNSVFSDIDVFIENAPAQINIFRNLVSISDSAGSLPPLFIVKLRLISKTGETIEEIINRNTTSGLEGKPLLAAVPVLVNN